VSEQTSSSAGSKAPTLDKDSTTAVLAAAAAQRTKILGFLRGAGQSFAGLISQLLILSS
jgi:hypothetical protein